MWHRAQTHTHTYTLTLAQGKKDCSSSSSGSGDSLALSLPCSALAVQLSIYSSFYLSPCSSPSAILHLLLHLPLPHCSCVRVLLLAPCSASSKEGRQDSIPLTYLPYSLRRDLHWMSSSPLLLLSYLLLCTSFPLSDRGND